MVSLHKTSIYHQDPRVLILSYLYMLFLTQVPVAIDLHFMNHHEPLFQLKIFFTGLLKKKVTYILDG